MQRTTLTTVALLLAAFAAAPLFAQERERSDRPGRGPGGFRGGFGMMRNPIMDALDANSDGELSPEEIAGAVAALKKLDKNSDGKVSEDELRPAPPTTEETVNRFLANDKNKDGSLSADEVPERLAGFLGRADEDENGQITKAELTKFVEGMASRGFGGRGFGGRGRPDGDRPQRPERPE